MTTEEVGKLVSELKVRSLLDLLFAERPEQQPPISQEHLNALLELLKAEPRLLLLIETVIEIDRDLERRKNKRDPGHPFSRDHEGDLAKMALMSSATGETRGQTLARMCIEGPFQGYDHVFKIELDGAGYWSRVSTLAKRWNKALKKSPI